MSSFDDKLDEDTQDAFELTAEPFGDGQPEIVSSFLLYGDVTPGATIANTYHQLQCLYRHLFGHRAELEAEEVQGLMNEGHRMALVITHGYEDNISLYMEQAFPTQSKENEFDLDAPANCLEIQINLLTSIEIERNEAMAEQGKGIPSVGEYVVSLPAEEEDDPISVASMSQEIDPAFAQRVILLALPVGIKTANVWVVPPGKVDAEPELPSHSIELLVPPAGAPEEWLQGNSDPADVQVALDLGSAFLRNPAPVGFTRLTSLPEMINAYQNLLGGDYYPDIEAVDDWFNDGNHIILAITKAYPENYFMNMAAVGTTGSTPPPEDAEVINIDCIDIQLNLSHEDNEDGGASPDDSTDEPRQVLFLIGIHKTTREVAVATLPPYWASGDDPAGDRIHEHPPETVRAPALTPADWLPGTPHRRVSILQ